MNLSVLRVKTGASLERNKTGKMKMEAGAWQDHEGMERDGVPTAQMVLDLQGGESTWNGDEGLNLTFENGMMSEVTEG